MIAAAASLATLALYFAVVRALTWLRVPPLVSPVAVTAALALAALAAAGVPIPRYVAAARPLLWLLAPAVVALGGGLADTLRTNSRAALLAVAAGAGTAALAGLALARSLHLPPPLVKAVAAKGVSSPFAILVMQRTGGPPALAAGLVIASAIVAVLTVPPLLRLCGIRSAAARGLAAGVSGNIIGTAAIAAREPAAAGFAAFAMALAGALTALLLPLALR